jgi:hypothetical protein
MNTYTCHKCDGKGYLNAFHHIDNGMCYTCMGSGRIDYNPGSDTFTLCGDMWEWNGSGICLPEKHWFLDGRPRTRKDILDVCVSVIKTIKHGTLDAFGTPRSHMEQLWSAVHLATFAWTTADQRVIARAGAVLADMPDLLDTFRWAISELDNSDNQPIL